jgi:DNA-binding GntR family transcriptional regulator
MLYSRTVETDVGQDTRLKWGLRDRYQHTRLLEALEIGDGELAGQVAMEAVQEAWDNLAEVILNDDTGED